MKCCTLVKLAIRIDGKPWTQSSSAPSHNLFSISLLFPGVSLSSSPFRSGESP